MNRFKILYWNTNSKGGKDAIESSKCVLEVLKKVPNTNIYRYKSDSSIDREEKIGELKNIDAIVFSEGYKNEYIKEFNKKLSILGFYLYSADFGGNCIHIYLNKKHIYSNNVEEINNINDNKDVDVDSNRIPDFKMIYIKSLNLFLCGIRLKNYIIIKEKKVRTGNYQICNVCDYIMMEKMKKEENCSSRNKSKLIIIGDFNPNSAFYSNVDNEDIAKLFKINGIDVDIKNTMNGGSMVQTDINNKYNNNKRFLQETFPDKILYSKNISNIIFNKLYTPEEIYCNDKYINKEDGHILLNEKENICKPDGYQKRIIKFDKPADFYKRGFNDALIALKYERTGVCKEPFPDHNLLFASVEV